MLNLVAGEEIAVETVRGDSHVLSYAETLVIPASVAGLPVGATARPGVQGHQGLGQVTRADTVVALDVGGTHVSAATVDVGSAAVVSASRVRTELLSGSPREELLDRLRDTATAARQGGVVAAGVAVPGPFDYTRGICLLEHKLESLYGVDLRAELAVTPLASAGERAFRERRRGVPPR